MLTRRLFTSIRSSQLQRTRLILPFLIDNVGRFSLQGRAAGCRLYAQMPPGGGFPRGFQGMNISGADPAMGEALKEFVGRLTGDCIPLGLILLLRVECGPH